MPPKESMKEKMEEIYYILLRFFNRKHEIKNWWYRITKGVGCCDLFGYYDYIARKIAHDLRLYKKHNMSWPGNDEFKTFEEWQNFIQSLIDDLDFKVDDNEKDWVKVYDEAELKQEKAMKRFAEHYSSFWI